MANQTLYSVGVGDFIAYKGGNLFAIGKFDTETSMEFSASYLDIRAGKRGKLVARYAHSSNATFSIIAANYAPEILKAAMGGKDIDNYGYVPFEESISLTGRTFTIKNTPAKVGDIPANVWIRYNGTVYPPLAYSTSKTFTLPNDENYGNIPDGAKVCVVYQYQNAAAVASKSTFTMPAEVEPAILHIFVNIDLVGDESGAGVIGHQIVEIPLAQLSPEQTINATMDGYSQSKLTGVMLADKGENACGGQGVYAYITTVIDEAKWYENMYSITNDQDDLEIENGGTATLKLLSIQYGGKYGIVSTSVYDGINGVAVTNPANTPNSCGKVHFTFALNSTGGATGTTFDYSTGEITAGTTAGGGTIQVDVYNDDGAKVVQTYTLEFTVKSAG